MRVLHLIDVASPWGGPCTQRLAAQSIARLEQAGWPAHDVLLIGRRSDARDAARCGLNVTGTIWPLHGRTLAAGRAFGRWLAACRNAGAAPDVIHAWSSSAGALAAVTAAAFPRVVTPKPLAVDLAPSAFTPRREIRERWLREKGVALDEYVLGLLGEPAERFDARQAMHVGARTGLSSRRIRMIMSGRALGRPEQQRFLARLDLDQVIVQDERITRPWEVIRGLDAALVLAPAPRRRSNSAGLSSLPALWAHAARVPVIAEANAPLDGLVTHDRTGLMFPPRELNVACDRLARLHDDRTLASRLTDVAHQLASDRFPLDVFCTRLDGAYRQAIEERRAAYLENPVVAE